MTKHALVPSLKMAALTSFLKNILPLCFTLVLLLESCTDDDTVNPVLIAQAGPDQQINIGQLLILDASASSYNHGRVRNHKWAIRRKPAASKVVIPNATQMITTFVPDVAGIYEIELEVFTRTQKATDTMLITVVHATLTK